jgi:hypothetical protein
MEELILLFLVATLLVSTVVSTREHMKVKKEPPPMSRDKSLEIVTAALEKNGPKGTLGLFDAQIQKMEDLAAHENDKEDD